MINNISDNIKRVKDNITIAAQKINTDPQDIKLICVSKTIDQTRIIEAVKAGITILGENRIQEAKQKIADIKGKISWHLIGHLQTNKAAQAIKLFDLIHSVDSLKLAREINRQAEKNDKIIQILIQINIGNEDSKYGIPADDLPELLTQISNLQNVAVQGLMCIPPFNPNPENSRPYFKQMYQLFEKMKKQAIPNITMRYLSMGMSNDYTAAISEGANMVRVGAAIFGKRIY